jgi:glycosyltransferase involved in cell wall biosynthesis
MARDEEFGIDIEWDVDLLSGYPFRIFTKDKTYRLPEQIKAFPDLLFWTLQDLKTPLLLVGWFVEVIWLIWLMRILFGAPVAIMGDNTPQSFAITPKPSWQMALLRWMLKNTPIIFYVGKNNHEFWIRLGVQRERLFYLPLSIDNVRLENITKELLPQREELCRHFGLSPEKPTFLFCCKLIKKKNPLELLDAYCSVGLSDKAQLVYIGEGALRSPLEGRIQELNLKNVLTLGFLNQSQMPLAYVLGEVLCLISDPTETWGLVVNEAMACGRPVLVSEAVGCAPDLVDETNGWVVPADDPDALARTLRRAYEERHTWEAKGKRSLEKISRHTYAAMADGVMSALDSLELPKA